MTVIGYTYSPADNIAVPGAFRVSPDLLDALNRRALAAQAVYRRAATDTFRLAMVAYDLSDADLAGSTFLEDETSGAADVPRWVPADTADQEHLHLYQVRFMHVGQDNLSGTLLFQDAKTDVDIEVNLHVVFNTKEE